MKFRYRSEEEMKDSGVKWIGKIPRDWEVSKIKYIKSPDKNSFVDGPFGSNLKSEHFIENGEVYVIESNFATQGILKLDSLKKISTEHFETIKRSEVKENDIVIAKIGAQFGLSNILPRIDKKAVVSGNSLKLSVDKQKSNTQYIHYQLLHIKNNGTLDLIVSTTAQPAISLGDMNNINIVLPNVQRQDKIVKFLNEKTAQVDSIISKKEALIQILEEAKKSLISDAVTGKVKVVKTSDGYELVERKKEEMKDSGVKWLGDVPKEWDVKRLRFLGNLQNGISKSGDEFGFGYPFVSYGDVYKNISIPKFVNGLVNSSLNDRRIYSVLEGDVFFTRTSETVDEIGFASTCLNTITDATFAGFLIRFRPFKDKLYKGFSKYYFRCDLNRKFFVKEMNLVTRASLSQNLLNNLAVALPLYKEQQEIYSALEFKVGGIECSINKLRCQIQKLKEAKQALISEAVTGKIKILDEI